MYDVFVSHVEEDASVALELALGLETAGYRTWCYEVDAVAGQLVFGQWGHAVESSTCLLLIISRDACVTKERNVDSEVSQAFTRGKPFIPVLRGVSSEEWPVLKPDWGILTAFTSIDLTSTGVAGVLPRIQKGLAKLKILPEAETSTERLQTLSDRLREVTGQAPLPKPPALPEKSRIGDSFRALGRRFFGEPSVFAQATLAAIAAVMVLLAVWTVVTRVTGPLVVAVMEFKAVNLSKDDEYVRWTTRNLLEVTLENIGSETVVTFSKEQIQGEIDRGLAEMDVVEKLGTHKMITGEIWKKDDSNVALYIRVVDIRSSWWERLYSRTGTLDGAVPCEGRMEKLIELQNECAAQVLGALHIQLTPEKKHQLFARRTNDARPGYERMSDLVDAFAVDDATEPVEKQKQGRLAPASPDAKGPITWGAAAAYAQDADKAQIRALLLEYQEALQAKQIDRLVPLHVEINDRQHDSLERYFSNARDLHVNIVLTDADIVIVGDAEAMATFTRTDDFTEVGTDKPVQLEVRITSVLTKQDGQWRIRGLRKPS